jgi:hypothetical protein
MSGEGVVVPPVLCLGCAFHREDDTCGRYAELVRGGPMRCEVARVEGPCGRSAYGFEARPA